MVILSDFAERLLEDVFRQGVTRVVEGSVLSAGSVKISDYSALSYFLVNGGNKSVILRDRLVSTIGHIGGINLSLDPEVSVGIIYDYLPPQAKKQRFKNDEHWIVGCLVSKEEDKGSKKNFPILPSKENIYFPDDTPIQNHYKWIRELPSCNVSMLFDDEGDFSSKFIIVFHGLENLLDANQIARTVSENFRGQNYIGICTTESAKTLLPYRIEGRFALVAGTVNLQLGLG